MAEFEEEAVGFTVCYLVARDALGYIHCSVVERKLYNLADMLGCQAGAPLNTQQIVRI